MTGCHMKYNTELKWVKVYVKYFALIYGTKYSRMDQVKLVNDSLKKI